MLTFKQSPFELEVLSALGMQLPVFPFLSILLCLCTPSYSSPLPDVDLPPPSGTIALGPLSAESIPGSLSTPPISPIPFASHSRTHSFTGPHSISFTRPGRSEHGFPTPLPTPQLQPTPTYAPGSRSRSSSSTAIIFETLASLAGIAIAVYILRCLYNYQKMPGQNRVEAFISRHQLEREMDEIAQRASCQAPLVHRPPPPYFPRPPSYEDTVLVEVR